MGKFRLILICFICTFLTGCIWKYSTSFKNPEFENISAIKKMGLFINLQNLNTILEIQKIMVSEFDGKSIDMKITPQFNIFPPTTYLLKQEDVNKAFEKYAKKHKDLDALMFVSLRKYGNTNDTITDEMVHLVGESNSKLSINSIGFFTFGTHYTQFAIIVVDVKTSQVVWRANIDVDMWDIPIITDVSYSFNIMASQLVEKMLEDGLIVKKDIGFIEKTLNLDKLYKEKR